MWRMPKERFGDLNVAEHDRYGKGSGSRSWFGQALASTEKLTCTLL